MFHGETAINLDSKGRMAIPTRYRDQIDELCGGRLVVTYNPWEPYSLWMYPLGDWEKVQREVMALPPFKENHRWLQRWLVGSAARVDPDGQGRILLPQTLRSVAGLDKRVTLMGLGHKFEIWDEENLNKTRQQRLKRGEGEGEPTEAMAALRL